MKSLNGTNKTQYYEVVFCFLLSVHFINCENCVRSKAYKLKITKSLKNDLFSVTLEIIKKMITIRHLFGK